MKQASLFDGYASLAGAIPAIKAAMRDAAKAPTCDGRKALPDMMNELAALAGVKLTRGNAAAFTKVTLDKMLSASDTSHPPPFWPCWPFARLHAMRSRYGSCCAVWAWTS